MKIKKKEKILWSSFKPYSILGTFTMSIQLHHIYTVIQEK